MSLVVIALFQVAWMLYLMRAWKITMDEYETEIEYLQKRIHALACDSARCKNGADE